MWDHLASCLIGTNKNQTFHVYHGSGSNGKSLLVDLMSATLGDYKGTVPITLVTDARGKIGGTSDEVLTHLKRNFPVYELKSEWLSTPIKQILVDDKLMMLEKNKKNLVSRIYNLIEERFPSIEESVLRRTIKKYLDGIK
jgi:hypothetical protein